MEKSKLVFRMSRCSADSLPAVYGVSRFRALVQLIKANPNYNEAIGQSLGIEGAQ